MANLVSGKLPPPAGMTYQQFGEYSLYLTFREFLLVNQGPDAVKSLDASYQKGSSINAKALLNHPLGKIIAALGRAIDEGGSLPGWNNETGTMDWSRYSSFVRWFAKLNKKQKEIVIARIRGGSDAPWKASTPSQQEPDGSVGSNIKLTPEARQAAEARNQQIELAKKMELEKAEAEQNEGLGTTGWLAIIAAVLGVGFILYKIFQSKTASSEKKSEKTA